MICRFVIVSCFICEVAVGLYAPDGPGDGACGALRKASSRPASNGSKRALKGTVIHAALARLDGVNEADSAIGACATWARRNALYMYGSCRGR